MSFPLKKNFPSLTNIDKVAAMSVSTVNVSVDGEEEGMTIYGVTPEVIDILKPDIIDGEFITEENNLGEERVVVMGIEASETFFGEDADVVGETISIDNRTFRVIGVAQSGSALAGGVLNNTLYLPFTVVYNQFPNGDKIMEIDVSVHDPDQINQTMEDVTALLRERHELEEDDESDFIIQSFQDVLTTVQTITSLLILMVTAISAISLVVGGVGVMNIMLVSVTERTKEIGLLKAIGAKENDILAQFLIESAAMTLVGGIAGVLIGVSGAFLISKAIGIPFVINILAILIAVGVSALVGIVFGLYPARRAAKLNPIDALRYE